MRWLIISPTSGSTLFAMSTFFVFGALRVEVLHYIKSVTGVVMQKIEIFSLEFFSIFSLNVFYDLVF